MSRLALRLLLLLGAGAAQAAEVTRVASSFEEGHPFGMYLDFGLARNQDKGTIVREWYGAATPEVRELQYLRLDTALQLDAHLGIFRDLELHVGVPVVFQQDRSWAFDSHSGPATTTIYRNCVSARGVPCSTPGAGTGHLFEVGSPSASYRSGLGDFTFGLAWAPYVQRKDPTKPTWVLRLDWTVPTSPRADPSVATSADHRGPIGERLHRYTLATALSKRLGMIEPYVELHYTLPWPGPGAPSTCDHPELLPRGENCGTGAWTRAETSVKPPHVGGASFGLEVVMLERPELHQRLVLDLRASGDYVSAGRYLDELSDLVGRLLTSGDYARLGGMIGVLGQPADFITLKLFASLAYGTARVITGEPSGVALSTLPANLDQPVAGLDPAYDFRLDRTGQRFRMTDEFSFAVQGAVTFNF